MHIEKVLNDILINKNHRVELIKQLQHSIWLSDDDTKYSEELRTLAYDLDFYEPDEKMRKESPSYYGDKELEVLISDFLKKC